MGVAIQRLRPGSPPDRDDANAIPLDCMFLFCSDTGMVDASPAGTPSAASPSTDEREAEVLSGLTALALELARTFQAEAVAALAAGDLERAGMAETRFSTLFLAIRRAVALKLRRRREQAAASPAADQAAMLSELMELAEELARGFHAQALAALAADDLDRAGTAETRFSSLFLGIRRAVALKIKLRQQREQARREAELRRKARQDETDGRRQAVAQGVAAAIAAVPDPEAREQLTAELREKLTEDERIDVDLADTALPIEALIASLCRALGLPPPGTPPAGGPAAGRSAAAAKAGPPAAGPKGQVSSLARHRAASKLCRPIPADDAGGPEGERRILTTGEIFDREPVLTLPDGTGPPDGIRQPATAPPAPDPAPPRDRWQSTAAERAGHRRRERSPRWRHLQMLAHIHRHG
ncbi:hypothetical protein [Inquilinus sp. OTU3971]|uniref:hypothetical protein n=1 Tax=Inquilinus sp. OTU3971 TaxID=3043855 RepID=UPI00313BCF2D